MQRIPQQIKEKSKKSFGFFNKKFFFHAKGEKPEYDEERIAQAKEQNLGTKLTQLTSPKTDKCSHHFGYLNQRSKGQKIPEECLTCQKVIECMRSRH
jgi:hypothetical protein